MNGLRAWNLAISVAYLLIAAGILVYTSEQSLRGRLFPWGAGLTIIAIAIPYVAWEWVRRRLPPKISSYDASEQLTSNEITRVLGILAWILGLFATVYILGVEISIPAFTFVYMVAHRENAILAAVISASCALFIYFVVHEALSIRFFDPLIDFF